MHKSAFLGCGPRARAHARAYEFVTKGKGVAACDLDEERRELVGRGTAEDARLVDASQIDSTSKRGARG